MSAEIDMTEFDQAARPKGPRCQLHTLAAQLTPKRRAQLDAALANGYAHTQISTVLRKWGFKVRTGTIARHRHGDCSCPQGPS